ncbi:single-stranded DNA-binding protein [Micromonospora sp. NPDC050187]|uniref:single-stranded DNA-binding protein n=1 Tax=Micromonospora sp. NPDC050187 TaxID=3364277 RepID=UPI00378CE7B0
MFDTYVTIVGNVLTAPEWRRTTQSGTLVANFKVASTARRLDRESGRWVDGNSLRVRVNCWRKLAEGVAASVMVGDPVVVAGRLYTRDWIDDAGNQRTLYELEAVTVGHDLARGRGRFLRNRPSMATSSVEDAEAERRVHGVPTEPVPGDEVPVSLDDRPLDDDLDRPVPGDPRRLPGFAAGMIGTPDVGPDPFDTPDGGSGPVATAEVGTGLELSVAPIDELAELPEEADDLTVGATGAGPGVPFGELDPLPEGTEPPEEIPSTVGEQATSSVRRARRGGRVSSGARVDGGRTRETVPA